jgi:hypothetical protein
MYTDFSFGTLIELKNGGAGANEGWEQTLF